MTQHTSLVLLAAVGGLLCACQATGPHAGRDKVAELDVAEQQYAAVLELHPVAPERSAAPLAQLAYEWGAVLPAAHAGASLGGFPLFFGSELFQLVAWPVYWGEQDAISDATVALHREHVGFWKLHGLFPRAGGGASYADDPVPPTTDGPRGDQVEGPAKP